MNNTQIITMHDLDIVNAVSRPDFVKHRIEVVKRSCIDNFLEMAFLLGEIVEKKYFEEWQYNSFKEYIENSGLDIQVSAAYRMVKIYEGANQLGLTLEELKVVKPSKLCEIFSLDPVTNEGTIRKLLNEGDTNKLETVKNKVREEKGLEQSVFYKFSVEKTTSENVVETAFELVRQDYGSMKDKYGDVHDVSNSKCFEYLCLAYSQMTERERQQFAEAHKQTDAAAVSTNQTQ